MKVIIQLNNYYEVEYLLSKGVKMGENGISSTKGRHGNKTYYLTESKRNLSLLRRYHEEVICK